jgi:hypothetical protein
MVAYWLGQYSSSTSSLSLESMYVRNSTVSTFLATFQILIAVLLVESQNSPSYNELLCLSLSGVISNFWHKKRSGEADIWFIYLCIPIHLPHVRNMMQGNNLWSNSRWE